MSHIPYTYVLNCPNGKRYYGVRYAKNCNPTDFWVLYFTSSPIVKEIINHFGKDSFTFEVRKTFTSASAAKVWEHKVLRRLKVNLNDNWVNCHHITSNGGVSKHTKEQLLIISQIHKGKTLSVETIQKRLSTLAKHNKIKKDLGIEHKLKNKKKTDEHCRSLSQARKNSTLAQKQIYNSLEKARISNTGKLRPEHSAKMKENARNKIAEYHVPEGAFIFTDAAAIYSSDFILSWCKNPDVIITKVMITKSKCLPTKPYDWVGRTRREVGFYMVS